MDPSSSVWIFTNIGHEWVSVPVESSYFFQFKKNLYRRGQNVIFFGKDVFPEMWQHLPEMWQIFTLNSAKTDWLEFFFWSHVRILRGFGLFLSLVSFERQRHTQLQGSRFLKGPKASANHVLYSASARVTGQSSKQAWSRAGLFLCLNLLIQHCLCIPRLSWSQSRRCCLQVIGGKL